ncbi:MAG: hypothetical protein PUJ39_09585 [Eubacteriales bacterium]|nr:hypothetical protein [Eubacteriales bacterium]
MKIVKWVCGILLLLFGADLVFVGAAGSWESLTSGQLVGLILTLPTAALGAGLIWLGIRLLRGRPGKMAQEQVPSKQEKAAREKADQEKVRKKAIQEAQERQWQEKQRWLEERPALKAQFDYLQAMLQRDVLSFYDPSGEEYRRMSDCRNHTGGEWMRTLPVYDLEQVVAFYQELWDAKNRLSQEKLDHAPYSVRCNIDALIHRRLYLRLNGERQLSALGDRKDALLERCREQDIHLILQPSRNEIVDLTDGMVYALHAEKMGHSPLTDEVVGGEVTLVPAERTASTQEREPRRERRETDPHIKQRYQEVLDQVRTLAPEDQVLIARLERVTEAFSCGLLSIKDRLPYIERNDVDEIYSDGSEGYAVAPDADLDRIVDIWLDLRAVEADLPQEVRTLSLAAYGCGYGRLLLEDERQLERSTNGKEALLRRCREHRITLLLNLGNGYYQDLNTGTFYVLEVGVTWPGSADDAATYGRLEWQEVPPLPSRPVQP